MTYFVRKKAFLNKNVNKKARSWELRAFMTKDFAYSTGMSVLTFLQPIIA